MSVNKIVQLSEWEYDRLADKANASDKKIEELAEKMYKEKGAYEISLSLELKNDIEDRLTIRPYSYFRDWDKFEVSMPDKKRLAKFVKTRAQYYMEKEFGSHITNINYLLEERKKLKLTKFKFIGLTIAGWLGALMLTLMCLFK